MNYRLIPKKKKKIDGDMIQLRRSIFASKNISINQTFEINNIETFRPKIGLCASNYFKLIGKKSKKNIKKGSPIFKKFVSNL